MHITSTVSCPLHNSFRVQQVAGMFDLPVAETCRESFAVEVSGLEEDWRIGVIVGPSGSGKTTVAREAFGDCLHTGHEWPEDRAIVDCFGERPIKEITHALTAVGLSSPPAWIKPYRVLSRGEQFRAELARALTNAGTDETLSPVGEGGERGEPGEGRGTCGHEAMQPTSQRPSPGRRRRPSSPGGRGADVVVFDEFTSVVDRTVAQIGSAAVSRAIRGGRIERRFVAVTCHYDVLPWLEPDWVVDMATCTLKRGRLRRPQIRLEIVRCRYTAWRLFGRHHYLSQSVNKAAHCYLATWNGQPVAFCAVLAMPGRKGRWRISRIVVLPDYQGIGVGRRMLDAVAGLYTRDGGRMNITTSHPAMIASMRARNSERGARSNPSSVPHSEFRAPRSMVPTWRIVSVKKTRPWRAARRPQRPADRICRKRIAGTSGGFV